MFLKNNNSALFTDGSGNDHTFIMGSSGKGKSVVSELARENARTQRHLLVDTEMFCKGSGLKPYECEYARRLVHGLDGRLPRELRGKPATIISGGVRANRRKKKSKPKHLVTTKNGFTLDRELVRDACDQLESQSGIRLNQPQLIALMEEHDIDETLAEYGEAETQIREKLADALSMTLIGRSWPTYGSLHNKAEKEDTGFAEDLNEAAKAAGYEVR